MNAKACGGKAGAWLRSAPLKSRWYDDQPGCDHGGNDASSGDVAHNRVRLLDERASNNDAEELRSREVERFFDLFDHWEPPA